MRIFATLFCLALLLVGPYWIYIPALILVTFIFPFYVEAIILALLIDVLYAPQWSSLAFAFPFGMIAAITVLLIVPIREYVRFNA